MRDSNATLNVGKNAVLWSLGLLALVCVGESVADTPAQSAATSAARSAPALAPDRFTATTTAMNPRDVTLRIDVREWSDDEARAAVVAALADADAPKALTSLPTKGYLWPSNSSVGYALKYAYRTSTPQGERVTFVTDRRLGAYDIKPWSLNAPGAPTALGYSVIELYLDDRGHGAGTLSLAADVKIDAASSVVFLAADAPRVLANAALEPKPYWATGK